MTRKTLPHAFAELGRNHGTMPRTEECRFDPRDVLGQSYAGDLCDHGLATGPVLERLRATHGVLLPEMHLLASEIARLSGRHAMTTFGVPVEEAKLFADPAHVYDWHAGRHAYVGTLFLALLDTLNAGLEGAQFYAVRQKLFARRRIAPLSWELTRHFGRPSVPSHVFPVVALFEAEKTLGRPLNDITPWQLEALGIL